MKELLVKGEGFKVKLVQGSGLMMAEGRWKREEVGCKMSEG